ncbi:MAG TPA: FAD binding domain-containing protein [Solirubrobacteraceae bacterium]|nr:FAD binding domain-containing protein [Solirubrobacteraceae bacterium]
MKAAPFSYCRPESVEAAIAALAADPEAVPLAGGQSLLAMTALRRSQPSLLVDLEGLAGELGQVVLTDGTLRMGALVRQADLHAHPLVRAWAPPLAAAARLVATPQVRHRGTIGGTLAHADPAAELPAVLTALGAVARVCGPGGEREVGIADLAAGPQQPLLGPGELIAEVILAGLPPGTGWAVEHVGARFASRPLVAAVAVAAPAGDAATVVVAGLAARPTVVLGAGDPVGGEDALVLLERRLTALAPVDDGRASLAYRLDVAATLAGRALRRATRGPRPAPDALGTVAPAPPPRKPVAATDDVEIAVAVNGVAVERRLPARTLLSELVRDELRLTGTHVGCEHGVCGACNVLLDGVPVRSCLTLAAQADGRTVTTVEGLRDSGRLDALLPAFAAGHALQCGFCTPGMLVTLAALDAPATAGREALVGNLCRCTGYRPILEAAAAASAS